MKSLSAIGAASLATFALIGRFATFIGGALARAVRPPFYGRAFAESLIAIGYFSLPVVGLTALFTGAALALQIHSGSARLDAEAAVPSIVAIGMVRELGPVLCGLIVAGRVASSIAAELATMKVTEQIDALTTLSTDPTQYLVVPRIAAATLALPVLTAIGDVIGILGGYLVATWQLGFASHIYIENSLRYLEVADVASGIAKAAAFGFVVASVGCYCGMTATGGAKGVGRATTSAVGAASVLIIAVNYLMTAAFFGS